MISPNTKKTFNRYSKLFHKNIPYAEIEIPETTIVRGVKVNTKNRYDVPVSQINNKECYFPAISDSDPNYNVKQINKAYCKKVGLLNYKDIQAILNRYDLSIRQFAYILGISPASLCNMKNGKILPSKLVSNILCLLVNRDNMKYLINKHKEHAIIAR